jgi:hypothetical protein
MPSYMLLLYGDPTGWEDKDQSEIEAAMALHGQFTEQILASGAKIISSEALELGSTATTVRNRDGGEQLVTDGPFAETKEELGGYYLIEARDLDHALSLAKQCPEPNVEVRPVMPTE